MNRYTKLHFTLFVTIIIFMSLSYAQAEEWISSVEYDTSTGNYIITYGTPDHLVTVVYELPNKVDGKIKALVDVSEGVYNYNYKIFNQTNSQQDLHKLFILTEANLQSVSNPLGWRFDDLFANKPIARWTATKGEAYRIKQGNYAEGFKITSTSLPGIVKCYFGGYVKGPIFPEEYPDEVGEALRKMVFDLEKSYVAAKTIGPTVPPAVFKPLEFIDNIINLKHEAFSLGWIKNQGIVQSLDAKLDNAKKKLENGDVKTAKNILSAFINEVEAQGCPSYENCPSGKHLTSEAYGLLKYNAQYLIDKLP